MTRPLRLKIHDALQNSLLPDAEGLGIFIGGRRRNRKKKNKKNGQNKKKAKKHGNKDRNSSGESCSSSDSGSSGRSSPKSEEKLPLLSYCLDENENFDPEDPYSCFCDGPDEEGEEDIYNAEMSFLFKRKAKEVKAEKAVVNELQTRKSKDKSKGKDAKPDPKAEAKAEVQAEVKEPEPVQQVLQEQVKPAVEDVAEKAVDGGATTEVKETLPVPVSEGKSNLVDGETKISDGDNIVADAETKTAGDKEKSEKSPLVNGKDLGPGGCLCCTIL